MKNPLTKPQIHSDDWKYTCMPLESSQANVDTPNSVADCLQVPF